MKFPWKKIFEVGAGIAAELVPGGDMIFEGAKKLLDKEDDNNIQGVQEIETGVIASIQAIKPEHVRDEDAVKEGTKELYLAFAKIRSGLKPAAVVPPTP